MASVNPEIGNPSNTVERQLQMLSAAIEWVMQQNEALMRQNQALEIRVKQLRKQWPEVSNHQERSNNHQTRNDCRKEDEVESNASSRQTRREDAPFRRLDAGNMWWEDEMKVMKDRMDLMMNAMEGRTATLDDLVHRTDSPFTAQVTSCLLPQVPDDIFGILQWGERFAWSSWIF